MKKRDNFSKPVVNTSGRRAGFICSNPRCRAMTLAPSDADGAKFQYSGKVAHITAAAAGGPRYDPALTTKERASIDNAIFLCSNCAETVDKNDGLDYPASLLRNWKTSHEAWIRGNLNKPLPTEAIAQELSAIKGLIHGGDTRLDFRMWPSLDWVPDQMTLATWVRGKYPVRDVSIVVERRTDYVDALTSRTQGSHVNARELNSALRRTAQRYEAGTLRPGDEFRIAIDIPQGKSEYEIEIAASASNGQFFAKFELERTGPGKWTVSNQRSGTFIDPDRPCGRNADGALLVFPERYNDCQEA